MRDYLSFHKENLIAVAIGLALIAGGLALFLSGWVVALGLIPLPILGGLVIAGAVYRIVTHQKGH